MEQLQIVGDDGRLLPELFNHLGHGTQMKGRNGALGCAGLLDPLGRADRGWGRGAGSRVPGNPFAVLPPPPTPSPKGKSLAVRATVRLQGIARLLIIWC